ncbi:MAG: hypothetical protein E6J34_23430 [Chloroflexi bacterium]|nr:MAG: hypothetical protein E6J34_23430 [Chloroflexota bacterium]
MSGFSLKDYSNLLLAFKNAGYVFSRFEEINSRLEDGRPFVVLRHDIDISLRAALEIAHLEYEHGVQATYFVLFRSPFYNILSRSDAEIIQRIQEYGHRIATHLDLVAYGNDCAKALMEVEILSKFYPYVDTEIVSLHSSYDLEHMPIESFPEINRVYGSSVRGDVAYISDSTGRWRYGHPLDSEAFHTHRPIQLLTHPIWWVQQGETPAKKLDLWLYSDYQNKQRVLREFLPKLFKLNEA